MITEQPSTKILNELSRNGKVFQALLSGLPEEAYTWKPSPEKWCLLEIICHLYDEEREDFRARTKHVLENPTAPFASIDPQGWVKERSYMQQNYQRKLSDFIAEREQSVVWLQHFPDPKWDSATEHQKFGKITAKMLLSNWLAHDYLHIRQIAKLKYDYLKQLSFEELDYAGNW